MVLIWQAAADTMTRFPPFEKAHELNPSYVIATANLAKTVWKQTGNVQRAKELYEEAVQRCATFCALMDTD